MTSRLLCFVGLLLPCCFNLSAEEAASARTLELTIVDADGDPVPGVSLTRNVGTDEKDFETLSDFRTDSDGRASVTLPSTMRLLRIWLSHKNHPSLFANFDGEELKKLPAAMTVMLPEAMTIGGIILDEAGEPIANAGVEVRMDGNLELPNQSPWRYSSSLARGDADASRTNQDGRWEFRRTPPSESNQLRIRLRHDDFISDTYWGDS